MNDPGDEEEQPKAQSFLAHIPINRAWQEQILDTSCLRVFAHRGYRLLWGGTVATQLGVWIQQVALGWLVLDLTDSPLLLGLVGFARGLPMLLCAIPAGIVLDKFDRRIVLMIAQTIGLIVAAILAVLVVGHWIQPWEILVLTILGGAALAFIAPTRQTLVRTFVPTSLSRDAITVNAAGQNATRIIGPSIGGLLIGPLGVAVCFVIQAAGFLWALVWSYQMHVPRQIPRDTSLGSWDTLRDGLSYVRRTPGLTSLLLIAVIPTLFAAPFIQMLPVFARDVLDSGSFGLGLLMAASGIGALLGALIYAVTSLGMTDQARLMYVAAQGFAITLIVFALSRWLLASLILIGITSGLGAIYMSANNTLIQLTVDDAHRGRILSMYLVTFALMPFGSLPMGALSEGIGAPAAVAAHAVISIVLVVIVGTRFFERSKTATA